MRRNWTKASRTRESFQPERGRRNFLWRRTHVSTRVAGGDLVPGSDAQHWRSSYSMLDARVPGASWRAPSSLAESFRAVSTVDGSR